MRKLTLYNMILWLCFSKASTDLNARSIAFTCKPESTKKGSGWSSNSGCSSTLCIHKIQPRFHSILHVHAAAVALPLCLHPSLYTLAAFTINLHLPRSATTAIILPLESKILHVHNAPLRPTPACVPLHQLSPH